MAIQVTIGVCLRNCEKEVEKIIKNITNQDFPHDNTEVIFVDDGSEDETLFLISRFASGLDMQSKVFHHEWKGLGYSRNVVLRNAEGDYIVWIDDGTILSKSYVTQNIKFLKENPNVGMVKGLLDVYAGSNLIATLENMSSLAFFYKNAGNSSIRTLGTGGTVYRVKAARDVGGFDEQIQGANEDTDISFRILSAGWRIYITQAKWSKVYNKRFKKVWAKNFWYGYGSHFVLHKHKGLTDIIFKSTPLAGLLHGTLIFSLAYKLTHKKRALLLPLFYFMIRCAFCFGFIRSHLDSYGH